ncbi:thiamine phosphate synthase [Tropicimonas sp.]|uniref:thiamine phosphate synthase n=1 Tax=Tropicimonas sp. TaxID=2067044 RepID=UPI003A8B3AD5
MSETEQPQIYLITPPEFELSTFPDRLAGVLDSRAIACVRLALASQDEDRIARAADACRTVCYDRDVALVIETHLRMVERLGLDGVHLTGVRGLRDARKALGEDAIVGAFCGASRHDGMAAGETGADYVAFGPVAETGLGDGTVAPQDLFAWWSEMIEVPVVAEGGLTPEVVAALAPVTDFFGIREIWPAEDPAAALAALMVAAG